MNWRTRIAIRNAYRRLMPQIRTTASRLSSIPADIWNFLKETQERHLAFKLKNLFGISFTIFLFFWLKRPLLKFFNEVIIANTLDKIDISPLENWLGVFYIFLVLITLFYFLSKFSPGKFKPSAIPIFILLSTSIIYCLERVFRWNYCFQMLFTSKTILGKIAVLDPIFFLFFSFSMAYIVAEILTPRLSNDNSFINPDHPISNAVEDEFERNVFVQKMANWLNGLRLSAEKSFVIGLNGSWGFGKSSLLQMISKELGNGIIKVDFNPWIANKEYNLIKDFFNTLNEEISKHIATGNLFQKYGKKLTKIDDDKNPFKAFGDLFEDEPLKKSFKELTDLLKKLNKPVFILIDDVDRLNKEEIYEILRLVRSTASFSNLTFIIAYDRQYIEAALKANLIPDHDRYLEKIIQLEIKIPAISDDILKNTFVRELKRQIDLTPLSVIQKQQAIQMAEGMVLGNSLAPNNLKYGFSQYITKFLRNKRDIVRLSNAFVLRLSFYYDQVYIPDLFLVEFIRIFLPLLHEKISFQSNNYVHKNKSGSTIQILDLEKDQNDYSQMLQPNPQLIKFIESNYDGHSLLNEIKLLIHALISSPAATEPNNDYGIFYQDYYDSYFTLVVPNNVVNLTMVTNLLQTPQTP